MRARTRSGLPSTVAGLNLHRLKAARAASSRRRKPDERSTLLSITLPSRSIRKLRRTVPTSFARSAAAGYEGFSQVLALTTGGVRIGSRGLTSSGTCTNNSGGGIYGGGGAVRFGGGGGGGLSGGGALTSSMIFVSRG